MSTPTQGEAKAPELTVRLREHLRESVVMFERGGDYWSVWFYTVGPPIAPDDRRLMVFCPDGVGPPEV